MISHKHKCIFIHIAKCAGTSVEYSFGVNVTDYEANYDVLFGWDDINKIWLQHATPQQLLDLGLISKQVWNTYYKFIIYRNSWDRAQSDFNWMLKKRGISDTFENFVYRKGNFTKILNDNSGAFYAGDHLELQKSYFFLNNNRIKYDIEINFDNLYGGLRKVEKDLGLKHKFFNYNLNKTKKNKNYHYSHFYNDSKKELISNYYNNDIEFFKFKFEDNKTLLHIIKLKLRLKLFKH